MPVEKDYPLRKGDIVSVRGVVRYADENTIAVEFAHSTLYPDRKDLELVQPKFDVGEKVLTDEGTPAEIKAIVGTEAWVESESGAWICYLADLQRAPAVVEADGESHAAAVLSLPPANDPDDSAIGAIGPDEDAPSGREKLIAAVDRLDALSAVKNAINADPNVHPAFKSQE